VFTFTLPKLRLDELTARLGTAAFSWSVNVFTTFPALAVRVAVCDVLTAETVAVKLVLVAPAGTVTAAGTATAESLLARFTVKVLLGAALSVTVHASVPVPVIDELLHERVAGVTATGLPPEGVRSATICIIHEPEALIEALAV
jgi:hypothetical protein